MTTCPPTRPYRSKERENYWNINAEVIKRNRVSFTRLISVDNKEKLDWVNEQLEEFAGCDKYRVCGIHLGDAQPVVLELLVVDSNMAMIWPSTHLRDEAYLWITGRNELVGALRSIFQSMEAGAWVLKDGNAAMRDKIDGILAKLGSDDAFPG